MMKQRMKAHKFWLISGSVVAVTLLTIALTSAIADSKTKVIYKWIDSQGVTHFTETAPMGQKAEMLTKSALPYVSNTPDMAQAGGVQNTTNGSQPSSEPYTPPSTEPTTNPANPSTAPGATSGTTQGAAGQGMTTAPNTTGGVQSPTTPGAPPPPTTVSSAQGNADDCKKAKDDIQIMSTHSQIRDKNPDGTDRVLTPIEQNNRITQLQTWVSKYCQGF